MPTLHTTQAHTDPAVCAGTAAGVFREAQAILYQRERKWGEDTVVGVVWVHSLVPKRFVWPSEHDLHQDPEAVSSSGWPGSTDSLPL